MGELFDKSNEESSSIEKTRQLESRLNQLSKELQDTKQENENFKNQHEKLTKELAEIKKDNDDIEFLRPYKTIAIAVSGDVMVNRLESRILKTLHFQRLRKIKQLGSTFLVYPSAVHTRFEHSLGVLKEADSIINKIRQNLHSAKAEKYITAEEEQIVRLLALLHDIGHMPYGHTIEDEFCIFKSHDKHEARWNFYLGEKSPIGEIIIKERGLEFYTRFYQLIKCEKNFEGFENDAFMYDIVSNTVCADLLDYLKRDCFYTNLQIKSNSRFLNYLFITRIGNSRRIAIRVFKTKKELRHDIVSELIQLLRNRYYIGERVYYHHAKIKTGTLIAGAVLRAEKANCFSYEIPQNAVSLPSENSRDVVSDDDRILNIHTMSDEELLSYLLKLEPNKKKDLDNLRIKAAVRLARAFNERTMYHELIYKTKENLGIEDEFDTKVLNESPSKHTKHYIAEKLFHRLIKYGASLDRLEIEENICDYLQMESGDMLIYCPHFNMAMKLAKVNVEDEKKDVHQLAMFPDKNIRNECNSIIEKHQRLWALRIFVHPRYIDKDHPEYKDEFDEYIPLITSYCDWTIFAKDEEEENKNGETFWTSYIDYVLSKYGDKLNPKIAHADKRVKTKELVREFVSNTHGDRKYSTICKVIEKKFGIKTE